MTPTLIPVRCPRCQKLVCEVTAGSLVRAKCTRCHFVFRTAVGPSERSQR